MKPPALQHVAELFNIDPAGVHHSKETTNTILRTQDSVMVATLVVKEQRESLLIKLPEATSTLAEQGNTLPPAITWVFPRPYRSSKKVMQAVFFDPYQMVAS